MVNVRSSMVGSLGEDEAVEYLKKQRYTIVERNFRTKGGEVDIIARVNDTLVFVEVKARSSARYGFPEDAVGPAKRHRMARAARRYLLLHPVSQDTYIRFDIVALQYGSVNGGEGLRHIEDIDIGEGVY